MIGNGKPVSCDIAEALMIVIIILLCVFSFLVIWQFVGYPSLMGLIALRWSPKKKDSSYEPYVSIIVPALNEEKVIKKRIDNLLKLDYPGEKYEIIVVDDGSADNTSQIVEELVKKHQTNSEPCLKLVRARERKGKAYKYRISPKFQTMFINA